MKRTTCDPGRPMIRLGEGEAPILDYSLPQSTSITAYGLIPIKVDPAWFLPGASAEKEDRFRAQFQGLSAESIAKELQHRIKNNRSLRSVFDGRKLASTSDASKGVSTTTKSYDVLDDDLGLGQVIESMGIDAVSAAIAKGARPVVERTLAGRHTARMMMPNHQSGPRIFIMEEYRISSWLGDYGAGKTVSTFTLLPGERTTISLRSYRDRESTRAVSENVLDSFSETSADEMERLVEEEQGVDVSASLSGSRSRSLGLSAGLPIKAIEMGVDANTSNSINASYSRQSHARTLERALEKHVETSTRSRQVEVNTSTSVRVTTGEEQTVTRELININRSRVLNFVFRQLLQEYITLVWLNGVKFVFTAGSLESTVVVDLPRLDEFLSGLLSADKIDEVRAALLKEYCKVYNYRDQRFSFIEEQVEDYGDCPFAAPGETLSYWRKRNGVRDRFKDISVPGVILRASSQILPTDSIIGDALLGQGEALDCYNMSLQDAAVQAADLANQRVETALGIINLTDPAGDKAAAYNTVFNGMPKASAENMSESEEEGA